MANNQFEQLTKEILKVEEKLEKVNAEIKDLLKKERNADEEELLSILKDDRSKLYAEKKRLQKERDNLNLQTGQSPTIANVAHHAIKHSPVTPRLAIESFPQLNIDHSASVVELKRPIVLVNKYLRTGLFKEVYKLYYSSKLAAIMLPQVEIRFGKYEAKLNENKEVLAWVYRKPPLEQKIIYIDERFCNAMDIACESQKILIEFYITMLIIHELGHIFTRWKTGEQYSPGNLEYCKEPEAGYYLQYKLFDCIVRVSGSSSDLCFWNEETRLYGVVKQKFTGNRSSPEPFLYSYIDESYIKDALDGKIESSKLLPLKDKLGPDGKPLMMKEGEHAMFSNNKCTDDVCNPSAYNLVEADPSTLLKGDI